MSKVISDYLKNEGLGSIAIARFCESLSRHPEIQKELRERISGITPSQQVSIVANGEIFTANKLMANYLPLSKLHQAYSYLIFIKEEPVYATRMLARGLPLMD